MMFYEEKTLLACFLAVLMGANFLLTPPPSPSTVPTETVEPHNNLWDGEKN